MSLFSRYERGEELKRNDWIGLILWILVTDRRTFKDRRGLWSEEKKKAEFVAERPKAKIKHNTPPPEENPVRRNKADAGRSKNADESNEELVNPSLPSV